MPEMTPEGLDALQEAINIGIGQAAASLNQMLETHIDLDVPEVEMATLKTLMEHNGLKQHDRVCCVTLSFNGGLNGTAALLFSPQDAAQLVSLAVKDEIEDDDLDALRAGTISEVGNIVINGVMGTLGNILRSPLDFTLPSYVEGEAQELLTSGLLRPHPAILLVRTRFRIERLAVVGNIVLVFELLSLDDLLHAVLTIYDYDEDDAD